MLRKIKGSRYFALVGLVVICSFVSMGIFSCTNFEKNTYGSLYASGSVYDMGMTTVKTLQAGGIISADQRVIINKAAITYKASYVSAVSAFRAWKLAPKGDAAKELQIILQNVLIGLVSSFDEWQKVINTFSPGTIQGKIALKEGVQPKAVTEREVPALKNLKGTFPQPKKIDPATVSVLVSVIGLIIQYGLPQLGNLMENLKKETITVEDIEGLFKLVKDPETY